MATFVVERYVSRDRNVRDAVSRVARLAAESDRPGRRVRDLWSVRIAADETWLCCFEAPEAGDVADLNRRASFPFDRISEAELVLASPSSPSGEEPS